MQSGTQEFNSAKLSYTPTNNLNLEVLFVNGAVHAYFQSESHTLASHEGDSKNALLSLIIGDTTYSDIVPRHQGGQRVSLSEKMQEILLSSLKQNLPLTARVGSLETIITAEKFASHYDKLKKALP